MRIAEKSKARAKSLLNCNNYMKLFVITVQAFAGEETCPADISGSAGELLRLFYRFTVYKKLLKIYLHIKWIELHAWRGKNGAGPFVGHEFPVELV